MCPASIPSSGAAEPPARRAAGELLRRVSMPVHRYSIGVGRALGVPPTDVHAVGVLLAAPGALSAAELGGELGLSASTTTSVIDRLEAAGHAVRSSAATDARRARIEPTPLARERSRDHFAAVNDALARALADSGPEDEAAFLRVLERVCVEMEAAEGGRWTGRG